MERGKSIANPSESTLGLLAAPGVSFDGDGFLSRLGKVGGGRACSSAVGQLGARGMGRRRRRWSPEIPQDGFEGRWAAAKGLLVLLDDKEWDVEDTSDGKEMESGTLDCG